MEFLYYFTTAHREVTQEEAERCRELIKKLKEKNDCKSKDKHKKNR